MRSDWNIFKVFLIDVFSPNNILNFALFVLDMGADYTSKYSTIEQISKFRHINLNMANFEKYILKLKEIKFQDIF